MKTALFIKTKAALILVLLCIGQSVFAQMPSVLWQTTTNSPQFFTVDKLGNTYLVDANNQILLHPNNQNLGAKYTDNTLGNIQKLDVTNPLEILAYYRDFQTIKVLDRGLNLIASIDLSPLNLWSISQIAASRDGSIWLFDSDEQALLKTNRQNLQIAQKTNLRPIFKQNIQADFIIEQANHLVFYDAKIGLLYFDLFGNFIKKIDTENQAVTQVENGFYFYKKDNQLIAVNLKTLEASIFLEADFLLDARQVYCKNDKIWLLDNSDKLRIYK